MLHVKWEIERLKNQSEAGNSCLSFILTGPRDLSVKTPISYAACLESFGERACQLGSQASLHLSSLSLIQRPFPWICALWPFFCDTWPRIGRSLVPWVSVVVCVGSSTTANWVNYGCMLKPHVKIQSEWPWAQISKQFVSSGLFFVEVPAGHWTWINGDVRSPGSNDIDCTGIHLRGWQGSGTGALIPTRSAIKWPASSDVRDNDYCTTMSQPLGRAGGENSRSGPPKIIVLNKSVFCCPP